MSEETLTVSSDQLNKLIEWLREVQKPQTIDELAVEYIRILQSENESD